MSDFDPLPLNSAELEQYRLNARRLHRPNLLGGHITRRRGQSLEFREFSRYNLGDDIRHVDWRASLRSGRQAGNGWLVRKFTAEEHYKLVVSLDVRDTMRYPQAPQTRGRNQPTPVNISKLQVARWLATAIAFVALRSGDEVVLHQLFGRNPVFFSLRGSRGVAQTEEGLDQISATSDAGEIPNLAELDRYLPPTCVWVIITDFYFQPEPARDLIERIASAQDGMRWVLLVDLDSWPYERHLLAGGPRLRRIQGPGVDQERRFDKTHLSEVSERILQHKERILSACQQSADVVHWPWPQQFGEQEDSTLRQFFRSSFLKDKTLRRLFEREAWS
jgi:hypothetical protein